MPPDRSSKQQQAAADLAACLEFIGISPLEPAVRAVDETKLEMLIAARTVARQAKNWAESDRIRDELLAMGIVLKDTKDGTTWEVAR